MRIRKNKYYLFIGEEKYRITYIEYGVGEVYHKNSSIQEEVQINFNEENDCIHVDYIEFEDERYRTYYIDFNELVTNFDCDDNELRTINSNFIKQLKILDDEKYYSICFKDEK